MGEISSAELRAADTKAALSVLASTSVEQAGRGLVVAFEQCKANTAGLHTIEALMHVQGHISDAVRALVERESPVKIAV